MQSTNDYSSTPTPTMPKKLPLQKMESGISMMSEASNAESRRESFDSVMSSSDLCLDDEGLGGCQPQESLSTSPMFTMQDLASVIAPELPVLDESSLSSASSSSPSSSGSERRKKRKKKRRLCESLSSNSFTDIYYLTGDVLGEGSYGRVETCINMFTDTEYAVKIISKANWSFSRSKVLKEIELYYLCRGQATIIQLIEFFEENDYFYLIFEKAYGGQLLDQIQKRVHFNEEEAASIIRDLALALRFLHERGIAHRDLKPENILCLQANSPLPIKLCDFDLCSGVNQTITTPMLQSPVGSAEYMAPEVVNAFSYSSMSNYDDDDEEELIYDKRCDLWSLGIIAYILLCGYLPFAAGKCDSDDCGWETGEECSRCTQSLFSAIRNGSLEFHEQYWSGISAEAKDLISKLLVKEASMRLDASSILSHPFIVSGGCPSTPLETPSMLRRQTSVKEFSDFATSALAIKRNFETNLSFTKSFLPHQEEGAVPMGMKKSATISHDLIKALDNRVLSAVNDNNSDNRASRDEYQVAAAKAKEARFRKTSAQIMRRQTSLVFPELMMNAAAAAVEAVEAGR